MASQPLSSLSNTTGLRDRILRAYEEFKAWKGAGVPDRLLYTHAHDVKSTSPMHRAGKAIDIVTDSYGSRDYLFEFGLFLWVKESDLTVHWYPLNYEPHIHVGEASGFGSGSYLVNIPRGDKVKGATYQVFKRGEVPAKIAEIIPALKRTYATYSGSNRIDWALWESLLKGEKPLPGGKAATWKALLKKYWWLGGISVLLLAVVLLVMKFRNKEELEYEH